MNSYCVRIKHFNFFIVLKYDAQWFWKKKVKNITMGEIEFYGYIFYFYSENQNLSFNFIYALNSKLLQH